MDIEFNEITFKNLKSLGVERNKNIYTLIEIHRVTGDVTVYDGYFDTNSDGSYKFEVDNDTIDFMHDLEYFDYFYCMKDDYENYIGGVLREKAYGKKAEQCKQDKYHLHDWLVDDNGTLWRIEGKDKHDRYVLSGRGYQIPQKATEAELDRDYTRWSANNARKGCMLMSEDKTTGILFKEAVPNTDRYVAFAVTTREADGRQWSELDTQECERTNDCRLVPMTDEEAFNFRCYLNRLGFDWSCYIKSIISSPARPYKVGDWLCQTDNRQWYRIANVNNNGKCFELYMFGDKGTTPLYADEEYLARNFVNWDITMADEGMPLVSRDGEISLVFKCIDADNPNTFRSHAFVRNYDCDGGHLNLDENYDCDGGHLNLDENENRCWLCEEFVPMARDVEKKFGAFVSGEGYGWDNLNKRLVGSTGEAKWVSDTLKPFDRVIVRDAAGKWKCAIYSHRNSSGAFVTTDSAYTQCLPYDDETAHLVGTKDDYDGKYGSYYNE